MTAPQEVLRRIQGEGWVVLAGGPPELGHTYPVLAERLVQHTDLSQPGLVLTAGPPTPDGRQFVEDVDVLFNSNVEVHSLDELAGAPELGRGLIALLGGQVSEWLTACDAAGLDESLLVSLTEGGLVFATQAASACFGSWTLLGSGPEISPGLAWLPGAIVIPGETDPAEREEVRRFLRERDHAYAIGLPATAILALGPQGQVEVWGGAAPRVALGKGWA